MSTAKTNNGLMIEGNIWKQIFLFSVPLVIGNLLQEMYNTVDSMIVGNYVGSEALAAVSAGTSLINLLIAFSQGTAVGAGVVVAQYIGAKDKKQTHLSVHTSLAIACIIGSILSITGVLWGRNILVLMHTPSEVLAPGAVYFRIYMVGLLFNVIYNMAASILNATGNAKISLICLGVASITNIVLDLLFICIMHMGVEGAALATDISQVISCILGMSFLIKSRENYRVFLRKIRLNGFMAKRIIQLGIPAGIQNMVISFSNVLIQSSVNNFGTDVIAGFGVYIKVDGFNIMPIRSFAMAATTFAGQNYGAGRYERIKKGTISTVFMGIVYSAVTGILIFLFATPLMGLFTNNSEVIRYSVMATHYFCPFYAMLSVMQILAGIVRGLGKTIQPMIIMLSTMCLFRVAWVQFVMPVIMNSIQGIYIVYPISWALSMVMMGLLTVFELSRLLKE